jgi:tetratricopeptide (TPR) repeat protein
MRFAFLALATAVVVGTAGCKEIDARRTIQQANTKYDNQKYEEARTLYEDALAKAPDLDIGHHNLGVTLYRLMKRRDTSAENKELALQAVEHLSFYLDRNLASDQKDES